MYARFEIQTQTELRDPRGERLIETLRTEFKFKSIRVSDIYWIQTNDFNLKELQTAMRAACFDPVLHRFVTQGASSTSDEVLLLEKRFPV